MAYGFKAINEGGEVIISSEQQNLHFIGLASNLDSSDNVIHDGGAFENSTGSNLSNVFPTFSGPNAANALDGRVLITYTITTTGRPLAFIKPNVNAYDRWYAVISQIQSGDEWTFQVLMSGITLDNFPELFCFVDANHIPEDVFDNDNYGMVVYRDEFTREEICTRNDGFWGELDSRGDAVCYASATTTDTAGLMLKSFDSRAQPLSILASDAINPRDYAPNEGTPVTQGQLSSIFPYEYETLDHDFHSNGAQDVGDCGPGLPGTFIQGMTSANCIGPQGETNFVNTGTEPDFTDISVTTSVNTNTKPYTDMMFACPSVGQAVFQRQAHGHNVGTSDFSTAAWWVMYRVAYRLQPHATNPDDNKVRFNAGWGTFAAGYNYIIGAEAENWNGVQPGEMRTGWAAGLQPYNSGVLINDENVTVIVADSTKYELEEE